MPHLSKRKLQKDVYFSIYEQLDFCITQHKNKTKRSKFLSEILTGTERIMMAKRVAIIAMLIKGASSYSIEKILKISSSTVKRLERALEKGAFKNLATFLTEKQKSKGEAIVDEIMDFIKVSIHPDRSVHWRWIVDKMDND